LLSDEAKEKKPNESCALLFGKKENTKLLVKDVFIAKNIDCSPVNFTISNEQLIQGYKMAQEKGLDVIGIFHSHPNSEPYPSSTDKKFMEINPVVWVIFSDITNDFKAYLFESEITEIPIVT
jgi:[CysO sulfur-carrier protein]-S-L-cysteine hydrolase